MSNFSIFTFLNNSCCPKALLGNNNWIIALQFPDEKKAGEGVSLDSLFNIEELMRENDLGFCIPMQPAAYSQLLGAPTATPGKCI